MAVDSPDIRPILLPKLYRSREEVAMFDFNRLLNALSSRAGATAQFQRMLEWKLTRISRTGRRNLCQRGGDCRRRLSLSRDLPRQGFAGLLLTPDRAVCAVPQRHARRRTAPRAADAVRHASCRLGRYTEDRDDAGGTHAQADRGRNSGAGARAVRLPRDRGTMSVAWHAHGAGGNRAMPAQLR